MPRADLKRWIHDHTDMYIRDVVVPAEVLQDLVSTLEEYRGVSTSDGIFAADGALFRAENALAPR